MSVSIKITAPKIAKDASSIVLQDTTGTFNAVTNPGGYGGTNVFSLPTKGFIKLRYWTDKDFVHTYLDATKMAAMVNSGFTYTKAFADGVQHFRYLPLYVAGNGTLTKGGTQVTGITGFDVTTFGAGIITHVVPLDAGGVPVGTPLALNWTAAQSAGTLNLSTPFTGTSGAYSLAFSVEVDLKVLVNKAAEKCIVGLIGKLAEVSCDCADAERVLNKLVRWRFASDVKFDSKDYEGSHNMVLDIGLHCQGSDCNC